MLNNRLDRPVDPDYDHVLGPENAAITLVEYGSYACPYCRAANRHIARVRDEFGDRLRYVFRHRPLVGVELARRAAELAERARDPEQFWKAHIALMTRSEALTEDDLRAVAQDLGLTQDDLESAEAQAARARARVEADEESARASGVVFTPTFFINGRRYDGAWDQSSLSDALLGTLGHRVRAAALDFASWGPSAGVLLLLATILALVLSNSPFAAGFEALWEERLAVALGSGAFGLPLRDWVNDALLTVFFLVVGLEIKREFTVGHLARWRSAALPVAGAIGGMTAPAAIYLLMLPQGPWSHGWGVPMATDTAFAVALIVMLGRRVPIELRIFLTAAAIVDDIGAIVVVALFYSGDLHLASLAAAAVLVGALALLNRWHFYAVAPYAVLGVLLWACVHAAGLHATLAGIVLALAIPTRPPADLQALMTQATTIMAAEAKGGREVLRTGPSTQALRALDEIHERLESPADRLLRHAGARSSYVVLPLFALANAGVALTTGAVSGRGALMTAIAAGLIIGKPLGILGACALAVRLRIAEKPDAYSWPQLLGAGALAGIGFTMSLFIAGQAFSEPLDFAAAKIAVFCASLLSTLIGTAVLWTSGAEAGEGPDRDKRSQSLRDRARFDAE
ncbi:MAG TPA: Na+/H+ antiporter NhaA [Xanthobacteraceae bacterium]|nr:Na+/H+ antiporter NhaA [Xanthobacteraceae bacterium]